MPGRRAVFARDCRRAQPMPDPDKEQRDLAGEYGAKYPGTGLKAGIGTNPRISRHGRAVLAGVPNAGDNHWQSFSPIPVPFGDIGRISAGAGEGICRQRYHFLCRYQAGTRIFIFCQSPDFWDATHRSKLVCIFSHSSADVLNAFDNLSAISGVTDPLSLTIFESVFLDTPKSSATSFIERDNGSR